MARRSIEIDNSCDLQPGDQLFEHPEFNRIFRNWKKRKETKTQGFADISIEELMYSKEARDSLKAYFNKQFVTARPEAFANLMRVVTETSEMVDSMHSARILSNKEITDRFNRMGIDIEAERRERENYYKDAGLADILEMDEYVLPLPELTEAKMRTIEKQMTKGKPKLAILDFRFPLKDKMAAFSDPDNDTEPEAIQLVQDSVRIDKPFIEEIRRAKEIIDGNPTIKEGERRRSYAELLKQKIAEYQPAAWPDVAFVVYYSSEYPQQESFTDSLECGLSAIADFELLLEQAAFCKYTKKKPHGDYTRSDIAGYMDFEHILGNVTADGRRVLVLEGDPTSDFHIKTYSPNTKSSHFVRQEVEVID